MKSFETDKLNDLSDVFYAVFGGRPDNIREMEEIMKTNNLNQLLFATDIEQILKYDGFFADENIRYFHMFKNRVERLYSIAGYLRDYTEQLGDVYHLQLEAKQNRIMTVLTVVSTIFMPLTLITGWFGMNFRYMPELESPWAYPIVIAISVVIIVASLIFFKKKKIL